MQQMYIIPLYDIYSTYIEIRLVEAIPRDIYFPSTTLYFPLNNIVFPFFEIRKN